jgi:hypothetical protein
MAIVVNFAILFNTAAHDASGVKKAARGGLRMVLGAAYLITVGVADTVVPHGVALAIVSYVLDVPPT